jgi:ribose transport system permease protein
MTDLATHAIRSTGVPLRSRLASIDQGRLIAAVTAIVIVFGAISVKGFFDVSNFATLIRLSAALGILAVGSAIVIMGKGVDLSGAAVAAIAAQGCAHLWETSKYGEAKSIALVVLFALTIGLINGWLVAYVEVPALFATLGTWKLFEGLLQVTLFDKKIYELPQGGSIVTWMGRGRLLGIPAAIIIAAIVFLAAGAFLSRTSYGRLIRAMGDNPSAARLSGAPVRPLIVSTFAIASLLAAVAGLVLLGKNGNYSTAYGGSNDLLFNAITAAVIGGVSLTGGKGSMFGVLAGTALTAVIVNILTLKNLSVMSGTLIKGLVLVAALALDAWLHPRDEETAKSDDL